MKEDTVIIEQLFCKLNDKLHITKALCSCINERFITNEVKSNAYKEVLQSIGERINYLNKLFEDEGKKLSSQMIRYIKCAIHRELNALNLAEHLLLEQIPLKLNI